ncbi:MAG: alanine--tRNA ligase-related protein [Candidatus Aminicenantales bacterium]
MEDKKQDSGKTGTQKIYFENAYQTKFEAALIEKYVHENQPAVVLDRTCFYPESGGQPADRGTINGSEVVAVVEGGAAGEKIIHVLKEEISADRVTGKIDWPTRFDHMQQHSGQHILSQSFIEVLDGETCSFHLGKEYSTLEIGLSKISEEAIEKVEQRADEIVFEDREIKTYFIPQEKIHEVPLRRPPKKEGLIRVVEVDGFDHSACGGTHCRRTGEVGLIKIAKWEKIRDNLRFEFLCGGRACADYALKNQIVRQLSTRLTVSEKSVLSSVEKLKEELKNFKTAARKLEEKLAAYEALDYIRKAEGRVIKDILEGRTVQGVRSLALSVIKKGDHVVLFGLKTEERAHLVLACSESCHLDMRKLIPVAGPLISGKGGGSPSLVELAGDPAADLKSAIAKAYEYIKNLSLDK